MRDETAFFTVDKLCHWLLLLACGTQSLVAGWRPVSRANLHALSRSSEVLTQNKVIIVRLFNRCSWDSANSNKPSSANFLPGPPSSPVWGIKCYIRVLSELLSTLPISSPNNHGHPSSANLLPDIQVLPTPPTTCKLNDLQARLDWQGYMIDWAGAGCCCMLQLLGFASTC